MRVTSKGQVTIPQAIREKLELTPYSEVDFVVEENKVLLVKKESNEDSPFKRLRGVATVKLSTDEIMALTRGDDDAGNGDSLAGEAVGG